ncbi:SDR family oxidoreductase [Flavobacterium sp. 14A]|uniref:SDR family oxidoreductase n=1 Tax=Flavobacterium sp. 14A TaxID=2735896 RepID=UPI00156E0A38|nr:SDR family oxidoreductase [Flavobacterium sp. 14A]NRT10567.1 uncharacterized protein YbjT (DUF2867 family) [Flavobacterium sp. 14A]
MKKTLVIGASGQIGKILVEKLLQEENSVVALVRNEQKGQELKKLGAEIVVGDLENDFEHAFKDCDKVVFSAGSGGNTGYDKTLLIDLWAAKKAVDYAIKNDIQHFIMVSGLGAGDPNEFVSDLKPYLVAKYFADYYLLESGLAYTILQPGSLINEKATGLIRTTRSENFKELVIPREDVANVIAYCLENNATKGKTVELFSGKESIRESLS